MTKVLVAEVDVHLLRLFSDELTRSEFTVICAKDGREAISHFVEEFPDIVILEKDTPDCLDVAAEILGMRPSTKVIMLIDPGTTLEEAECVESEIFLVKPVSIKRLAESVKALSNKKPPVSIVAR